MGFWGTIVIAHPHGRLDDLDVLREAAEEIDATQGRAGGWQTAQIRTPDADSGFLAGRLVAATGRPALTADIADSDIVLVRAESPEGLSWSVLLNPVAAAEMGLVAGDQAQQSTADTVQKAVLWAAESGTHADPAQVAATLGANSTFVEELVYQLADVLGVAPRQ